MLEAVQHEPSYSSGIWVDESVGLYVGWTTLKGSFCDGMPIANECGNVHLIFSGEEYPASQNVQLLRSRGHDIGSTESAYIVHLYEEDPAFVRNLNGMFHGVIADRAHGMVNLFVDRYGMHRLYYHEAKDAFYFAAEAKAILAVRPELKTIDPRGLGELVSCGCVLENRTLFDGISVLPGAAMWVLGDGTAQRKTTYFQPREWE